jgi:hypothetical protein
VLLLRSSSRWTSHGGAEASHQDFLQIYKAPGQSLGFSLILFADSGNIFVPLENVGVMSGQVASMGSTN